MKKKIISILGLCLFLAFILHGQLPVGTIRKPVQTDAVGNVVSTNLVFSNQFSMVPVPSAPNHLPRYSDLTNAIATLLAAKNLWTGSTNTFTGDIVFNGNLSGVGSNLMLLDATQLTFGTVPEGRLPATGVIPGTYGSETQAVQIVVDAYGRATGVTNLPISGGIPGGAAGGSLAGSYPNPDLASVIPGDHTFQGNIIVEQDLTVQGTNFFILSSNLTTFAKIMRVNDSGFPYTNNVAVPVGITGFGAFRGVTNDTVLRDVPGMFWHESDAKMEFRWNTQGDDITAGDFIPIQAGDVYATIAFHGNGSSLTNLSANQLLSGTIPTARYGAEVLTTNGNQVVVGNMTFGAVTIHSTNIANVSSYLYTDTAIAPSTFVGYRARGTQATPGAVQKDDYIAAFAGNGFDGTIFNPYAAAGMAINASENWTAGAHGSHVGFGATPNGTSMFKVYSVIENNGEIRMTNNAYVNMAGQHVVNLADGTNATDAVNVGQVPSLAASLTNGILSNAKAYSDSTTQNIAQASITNGFATTNYVNSMIVTAIYSTNFITDPPSILSNDPWTTNYAVPYATVNSGFVLSASTNTTGMIKTAFCTNAGTITVDWFNASGATKNPALQTIYIKTIVP